MQDFEKRLERTKKEQNFPIQNSFSARDNSHTILLPTDHGKIYMGAVGDMHLNSRLSNEKGIEKYYRVAQRDKGIRHFFSAGDQIDGLFIYPEQHLHLQRLGITEQINYAAEFLNYVLRDDSMLYIINGNHELGGRKGVYQCYGIDPSQMLADKLPNKVKYLRNELGGNMYASVRIHPRFRVDMVHTKKYVGNQPGSTTETLLKGMILGYHHQDRPDMLLVNHTHRHGHTNWQGVDAYLCGAFENPNNYTARINNGSEHGSYVFTVYVKSTPVSVEERWIPVKRGI